MLKLNAEIEAHRFHAYEMKARKNTVLAPWRSVEWFASSIFELLSDYQQNLWLPLAWLGLLWLGLFDLYANYNAVHCTKDALTDNTWLTSICGNTLKESFVFSFQQTLSPVSVLLQKQIWDIQDHWWKLATFFHALVAALIWFLWGLGIRKKFKL